MKKFSNNELIDKSFLYNIKYILSVLNRPKLDKAISINTISRPHRFNSGKFKRPKIILGAFKNIKSFEQTTSHSTLFLGKLPNWTLIEMFFNFYYSKNLMSLFYETEFKKIKSTFQASFGNNYNYFQMKQNFNLVDYSYQNYHINIFLNSSLDRHLLRIQFPPTFINYNFSNSNLFGSFLEYDIMLIKYLRVTRPEWYLKNVNFFKKDDWYMESWYTEKHYKAFKDLRFYKFYMFRISSFFETRYHNTFPIYLQVSLYLWWLYDFMKSIDYNKFPLLQLDTFSYEVSDNFKYLVNLSSPTNFSTTVEKRTKKYNFFAKSFNYFNLPKHLDDIPSERWNWEDRQFWMDKIKPYHSRFNLSRIDLDQFANRKYRWLYEAWFHENINVDFLSFYFSDPLNSSNINLINNETQQFNILSTTLMTNQFSVFEHFSDLEASLKAIWLKGYNFNSTFSYLSEQSSNFNLFFNSTLFNNRRVTNNLLDFFVTIRNDLIFMINCISNPVIFLKNNWIADTNKLLFLKKIISRFFFVEGLLIPLFWDEMDWSQSIQYIEWIDSNNNLNSPKIWSLKDHILGELRLLLHFFDCNHLMLKESLTKDIFC